MIPGGVPHTLIKDDWYAGHFFPKDTLFLANTWAIDHDESQYEDAMSFVPERWLNGNKFGIRRELREDAVVEGTTTQKEATTKDANEGRRVTYSFGAGRRACPGQAMAENSLVSPLSLESIHILSVYLSPGLS